MRRGPAIRARAGECLHGLYLQLLLEVAHQKATSEKHNGGYGQKNGPQHTLNLERQRPNAYPPYAKTAAQINDECTK